MRTAPEWWGIIMREKSTAWSQPTSTAMPACIARFASTDAADAFAAMRGGISLRAGQAVLADYRIKHRGLANHSTEERPLLYLTYGRPWWVDVHNFDKKRYQNLPQVSAKMTREERAAKAAAPVDQTPLTMCRRSPRTRKAPTCSAAWTGPAAGACCSAARTWAPCRKTHCARCAIRDWALSTSSITCCRNISC